MKIEKHDTTMSLISGMQMRLGYIGYARVGTGWQTHQVATAFNRLYLIENGSGILHTDTEELVLEPGKAYLLPAGLACSYHCSDSLSLLFFHFNLSQPDQFDLMRHVKYLSVVDFPADRFAQLLDCCQNASYTNAFEVTCTIYDLMLQLNRKYHYQWDEVHVYSRCVAAAIAEINQNLSAQLRIDDLAQRCFVSRSYLARQFRREVGINLKQYITIQLINTAQWQLSHTDASVEKISSDLGFCNQFYFSECFKKHCRVSPLQYKNGTKY